MDFRFTEEQQMMAGVLRDLLSDHCQPADLRRLMESDAVRDDARWALIADLGLAGVLVPEDAGGLGLAPVDFVQIAEACGYAALPEPLVENTGVALPLLVELAGEGAAAETAERALAGEITLSLAHPANLFAADADTAAAILVVAEDEVRLVEPGAAGLVWQHSIDPFRRLFTLDIPGAVPGIRLAGLGDANSALNATFERGALFAAAQMVGIAQRCVDMAVDYAKERQQFGKPIGSYQAIKHQLATCQVRIEFARPVLYAAAAQLPQRDLQARARVSQAKLAAAAAADLAARTAVQVHGAMGYSWEVDVHFFLKRALALTAWWGNPAFHRNRVADRVLSAPIGPEFTFAKEGDHA